MERFRVKFIKLNTSAIVPIEQIDHIYPDFSPTQGHYLCVRTKAGDRIVLGVYASDHYRDMASDELYKQLSEL